MNTTLFLFRNDLRLNDNQALSAARKTGQPLILLYIFDDSVQHENIRGMGSASRWWLYHSLNSLIRDLKKHNGKLILRRGDTLKILEEIIGQSNPNKLFFSRGYEPYQCHIEDKIYARWHNAIAIKRYSGFMLYEPELIRTDNDEFYKVFTPFWKNYLQQPAPKLITTSAGENLDCADITLRQDSLDDWALLPKKPDWASGFHNCWKPGETGALRSLKRFISEGLNDYAEDRDYPAKAGTSLLSPHLHFGEISPTRIWQEIARHADTKTNCSSRALAFLRQLAWRDFSIYLLFNRPDLTSAPFRKEYRSFPWQKNDNALLAWHKGQTGYPIIDAGMRQLWQTGWMHNRVRLITASFLVKHLLIDWRAGETWFWDTLVDADLANNVSNWQWVAGCGADAAPYFRIFNPILQGKKFDPEGSYVKSWIPELKAIPDNYIHEPWLFRQHNHTGKSLGTLSAYPEPIIEHGIARRRALSVYQSYKKNL